MTHGETELRDKNRWIDKKHELWKKKVLGGGFKGQKIFREKQRQRRKKHNFIFFE